MTSERQCKMSMRNDGDVEDFVGLPPRFKMAYGTFGEPSAAPRANPPTRKPSQTSVG